MDKEYEAAYARFNAASAQLRKAQIAYRARKIGDDEFLAARSAFIAAGAELDAREAHLKGEKVT